MPYEKHSELNEPHFNQRLWRYMDFPKFMALIQNKSLYFPNVSEFHMSDPSEGFPSSLNYKPEQIISTLRQAGVKPDNNKINSFINMLKETLPLTRNGLYINCWHMNDNESNSQWKIYGNNPMSLAIVSNFKRIKMAITDSKTIYGSKVTYYNPEKDVTSSRNALHHATVKRQAFSHEKEFRLIYLNTADMHKNYANHGISVDVELTELIETIVISPQAPQWFIPVVKSVINDYGFNIPSYKSNLLEPITL